MLKTEIKIINKKPLLYKIKKGNDIIIFNPYLLRKIFTSQKQYKKVLKDRWNYITEKFIPPKFNRLKKIRVEVSFLCNLRCKYCLVFNNNLDFLNTNMSLETAKKIVTFYKKYIKEGSLMIIGGEPLMNWKVTKFFVENIQGNISLFTNGTLIDDEKAKLLKKNNVFVLVSLDGPKEFNKMRVFPNNLESFDYALRGIKILQKYKCKVGVLGVATNFNVSQLDEIFKFYINNLKIKRIGISFPHYTEINSKDADVDIKKYTEQLINIFPIAIDKGIYIDQISKRLRPLVEERFRLYACKVAGEQITFYPNGKSTYCTKLDKLPIRTDKEFFKKRIPLYNSNCRNCIAIGICGGGCFWDGIARFGGVDKRECYLNKRLIIFFLRHMCDLYKRNSKIDFLTYYKRVIFK